jgi:hypothetical protein
MKLLVLALLLVPVVAMIIGFLIAARTMLHGSASRTVAFTADGQPVLLFAPRATLHRSHGLSAWPGSGSLLLSARQLVFERFFPRREIRVPLGDLTTVRGESVSGAAGAVVLGWRDASGQEREIEILLPDAGA